MEKGAFYHSIIKNIHKHNTNFNKTKTITISLIRDWHSDYLQQHSTINRSVNNSIPWKKKRQTQTYDLALNSEELTCRNPEAGLVLQGQMFHQNNEDMKSRWLTWETISLPELV